MAHARTLVIGPIGVSGVDVHGLLHTIYPLREDPSSDPKSHHDGMEPSRQR